MMSITLDDLLCTHKEKTTYCVLRFTDLDSLENQAQSCKERRQYTSSNRMHIAAKTHLITAVRWSGLETELGQTHFVLYAGLVT